VIPVPSGVRVWLAVGHTNMRRGMNSLAIQVQEGLKRDPHAGDLYVLISAFKADAPSPEPQNLTQPFLSIKDRSLSTGAVTNT
jgi:hypothetical protein